MSGKVLKSPVVRDYLRTLSMLTAGLPAAQARELRDQISAHLDDVLPPGATHEEVIAELNKLGTPRALAAAAAGPVPPSAGARMRNMLSRVRWWMWTSIAIAMVAIATVVSYLTVVNSVPPLYYEGMSGWYFPQDYTRSVSATAGDVTQLTIPARYRQQQGFVIGIVNDSDWTQTILGVDRSVYPDDPHSALDHLTVAVASGPGAGHGLWTPQSPRTRWILPAAIPPHSYRILRVLWTTNECMSPNMSSSIQDVTLRVRVGLITRTEQIWMNTYWAMTGTKGAKC